ncbi:MAG: HNH endonuclease [Caldilineaceae bacterium]
MAYQELRQSGLQVDHLCATPSCCNPDHLDLVTPSENSRRRGRHWRNTPTR